MGLVRVKGSIGGDEGSCVEAEFLADTGAFYTAIPPTLAEGLGIKPVARRRLILADKRIVEAQVSYAYIKLLDREGTLPVAILDVPEPLLGATALEGLGLRVDPTTGRLEHSRPYGLAII